MQKNNKKKVVVIGGGTGTYTVLSSLKNYPNLELSAIVSMADDGGSTGKLRDDYGVLPPGDIRRSLVALSPEENQLRKLFEYRFTKGLFKKHSFGNVFLTALAEISGGGFDEAVKTASTILNVKGTVIPVTLDNVRLHAELEDGSVVAGETNIDIPKHNPSLKITRAFLKPKAKANPDAIKAIKNADAIIIGPGDLYTSVVPNFLVAGIAGAVKASRAKKIYISNLMTKHGETTGFKLQDFIKQIESHTNLHYILTNNKTPSTQRLKKYKKENSKYVQDTGPEHKALKKVDLISENGLIRHDTKKLGKAIVSLI